MALSITINGTAYPCHITMGAMLRFKQETGREVSLDGMETSDCIILLWCCVVSACHAEGCAFDMSLLDFADSLSAEEMSNILTAWASDASAPASSNEKKTKEQRR